MVKCIMFCPASIKLMQRPCIEARTYFVPFLPFIYYATFLCLEVTHCSKFHIISWQGSKTKENTKMDTFHIAPITGYYYLLNTTTYNQDGWMDMIRPNWFHVSDSIMKYEKRISTDKRVLSINWFGSNLS